MEIAWAAALVENDRLRSENKRLRKLLRVREVCSEIISASEMETLSPVTPPLAADEKIRLFRSLFRGREDIYAVRWEGSFFPIKTPCRMVVLAT